MKPTLLIVLVILCSSVHAQFQKISDTLFFKQFNTRHGLSQAAVDCMLHDSRKFMWFGTDDGLNRFDPHTEKFVSFQRGDKDLYGGFYLKSDVKNNRLWIASGVGGVTYIDLNTDQIHHYNQRQFNGPNILQLELIGHKLYAETIKNGLLVFDLHTDQLQKVKLFEHSDNNAINAPPICTLLAQQNLLWAGTDGAELKELNATDGTVRSSAWWMTVYAYAGGLFLLACLAYGLYRYRIYRLNQRKGELERIVSKQNLEIRIKNLELATQNSELSQHNAELIAHRNTISRQNAMLYQAQEHLKQANQSLEDLVHQRTQKLNETIVQLNKTIKELDAFVYSASHDLAAPLKTILGLVYLAKREKKHPDSELNRYLDHIETSVRKLEIVIHTLIQHSFNTKEEPRMQPVSLSTLVDEAIDELHFVKKSPKVQFQFDLQDATVFTDVCRLKIVLNNLISNAIKYCDPGKDANDVEIRFSKDEDTWSLTVTDNGIGIKEDRLDRVFDMFYRATANAKGSGLGLYVAKEAVERMGGAIDVDSVYGVWTKFTISFPYSVHRAPASRSITAGLYAAH